MATPVFVAVDTPDLEAATSMVGSLQMPGLGVKLGLEFFCAHGAAGVRSVVEAAGSAPLFLDLKFHDIPNTVAGAVRATVGLGAALLNAPPVREQVVRLAKLAKERVMTPAQAMAAGATSLVVGRPITRADEPRVAAEAERTQQEHQQVASQQISSLIGADGAQEFQHISSGAARRETESDSTRGNKP
ncbi:hypothetical protein EMIHUDRAFT_236494 [Emiliania huxleyi CCMP1516]|uniref:Orotidine 5'-phosphate decarboxylase n=2 Tax=Emiliania huxleyi TaxID=2903 RepID=A0A0D3JTH5_EMIH1|nr:hypothetical protein EMIHUDRAFT_236494 [Emiliania huxleyi CCMP1516]EOD26810.1 hypothetical protein EMIHUDRAFT_236494 [Emiliania huxleyi CCMP1516]|eukprot:XP_005779239.1 hypothetical protein EMIHUDRAFT_236494 [Emiliania huxleyi CCMP1516]